MYGVVYCVKKKIMFNVLTKASGERETTTSCVTIILLVLLLPIFVAVNHNLFVLTR